MYEVNFLCIQPDQLFGRTLKPRKKQQVGNTDLTLSQGLQLQIPSFGNVDFLFFKHGWIEKKN